MGHSGVQKFEKHLDGIAQAPNARFAMANGWVNGDARKQIIHTRVLVCRLSNHLNFFTGCRHSTQQRCVVLWESVILYLLSELPQTL